MKTLARNAAPPTHYLYLLVAAPGSLAHGRFKLGVSADFRSHFRLLTQHWGDFDLRRSWLARAAERREVSALKAFLAQKYRDYQRPMLSVPHNAAAAGSGSPPKEGFGDWFAMDGFDLFAGEVLAYATVRGPERLVLERDGVHPLPWVEEPSPSPGTRSRRGVAAAARRRRVELLESLLEVLQTQTPFLVDVNHYPATAEDEPGEDEAGEETPDRGRAPSAVSFVFDTEATVLTFAGRRPEGFRPEGLRAAVRACQVPLVRRHWEVLEPRGSGSSRQHAEDAGERIWVSVSLSPQNHRHPVPTRLGPWLKKLRSGWTPR